MGNRSTITTIIGSLFCNKWKMTGPWSTCSWSACLSSWSLCSLSACL
jgi:hypothetical protein